MLIGELARVSRFSKDTIRYYEKIGLIELAKHARRENNYKDYPDETLKTLLSIRNLKELGFTLEEIREIIVRRQMNALDSGTAFKIIEQKLIHLDVQIDRLLLYKHRLEAALMRAAGDDTDQCMPLMNLGLCA